MFRMFTTFRVRLLASAVVAFSTLLMGGATPVHAATSDELYLYNDQGWCVTPLTNDVGAELVLGKCNPNAESQNWSLINIQNHLTAEILNQQTGYCMTYAYPNGHQDGGYMTQGVCVGAQNQTFETSGQGLGGGYIWWLPDRRDDQNLNIALDDAGNNLVVNNHIDGSYYCPGCASESWGGLNPN
jgi:hypothetical protein